MGDDRNNKKILQNIKMPEQSNDYRVVVFGAGGVGKSSLVLRFIKGTFRESYIPTIEDTYRQVISCNKNICTLQITDTTGSHQFPAMQRLSITKGHAFILVYSVCSKQSLEELKPIWSLIRELKGEEISQIPVMLVGNKCDEPEELREVTNIEGQTEAATWGISFMETSAKENHNVTELFQELLNMEKNRNVSLQLDGKNKKKNKKKMMKEQAKEEKLLKEKKEKAKQQAKEKEKTQKEKEKPPKDKANGTNKKEAAAPAEGEGSGNLKEKCKVM
ncbi:GTP-binding protein Di-Ras2 [Toxorhynchites rutilus septentrionalis]|uniref:GTP-binding protein Di-Ras2 n=1 Tax=Toxorhynchites rutilus septentrionalis TaxID=329112 RepID=UPI002478CC07|nr:GTP-binding protein Di-Ras2 [Toxorhynchites rutilus septentrionalis]